MGILFIAGTKLADHTGKELSVVVAVVESCFVSYHFLPPFLDKYLMTGSVRIGVMKQVPVLSFLPFKCSLVYEVH